MGKSLSEIAEELDHALFQYARWERVYHESLTMWKAVEVNCSLRVLYAERVKQAHSHCHQWWGEVLRLEELSGRVVASLPEWKAAHDCCVNTLLIGE